MQREMAQRRTMADVPTADVVVTNPTHFAVALKYDDGKRGAARCGQGTDEVAAKIHEIAKEHKVAMLEAPGDEIPEVLYAAVAEVLPYIFHLLKYMKDGAPTARAWQFLSARKCSSDIMKRR